MAERNEVHRGKMVGDVAERASHVVFGDTELIRYILCEFAHVEFAVDHDNADHGRRQEVGHIVIDGGKLPDFGLILGVDRIQFLVDRLQLFI